MTYGDVLLVTCSNPECKTEVKVPLRPPSHTDGPWSGTNLKAYMARNGGRVELNPEFGEQRKIRIFCHEC